jgi:hypothetical protein
VAGTEVGVVGVVVGEVVPDAGVDVDADGEGDVDAGFVVAGGVVAGGVVAGGVVAGGVSLAGGRVDEAEAGTLDGTIFGGGRGTSRGT